MARKTKRRKQKASRNTENTRIAISTRVKNTNKDTARQKKAFKRGVIERKASKHNDHHMKPKRPTYREMIITAFSNIGRIKTLSRHRILNYISANFEIKDKTTANRHLKIALNRCVTNGYLKHIRGHGANGSFAVLKKETDWLSIRRRNTKTSNSSTLPRKTNISSMQHKKLSQKTLAGKVVRQSMKKKQNRRATPTVSKKRPEPNLRRSEKDQHTNSQKSSVNRRDHQVLKPGQIELSKYIFVGPRPQDVFLRNPTW